jgi:hypothetical protein
MARRYRSDPRPQARLRSTRDPRSASWRLLIKVLRVNSRRDPPDLPRRHGRGLRTARFVGGVERLTRAPPSVKYGFYSNTLGANRVRLRFPPQAAPAKGRPKARTRRCINHAKRTLRRDRSTPPRGPCTHRRLRTRRQQWISRQPSQSRDCHQSKRFCPILHSQASDLRLCAPGRTRTCNLRI